MASATIASRGIHETTLFPEPEAAIVNSATNRQTSACSTA